jgi:hypothetical protein
VFRAVDKVFLDPVMTEVGVLLLDVCNGLIEIEPLSIEPDKSALLGIEQFATPGIRWSNGC